MLFLGWTLSVLELGRYCNILVPPRRFSKWSKVFCCSKSSLRSLWAVWLRFGSHVPRLHGQSWLGSGGSVHAFFPTLLFPAWPSLPAFTVRSRMLWVRTLRSAFMAVECCSYTLREAAGKHHLCVSVTRRVLGKALYIPHSEGCQNLAFSILQKASAGLNGWRDSPRVAQLVSAEAGSWRVHLSSKPRVHRLHPMAWPFCHIQHHARSLPFRRCFLIHEMLFEWLISGLITSYFSDEATLIYFIVPSNSFSFKISCIEFSNHFWGDPAI